MSGVHCIDKAWCDVQGVYLEGWVHLGPRAFRSAALRCGTAEAPVELFMRPDVLAVHPEVPPGQLTGFNAYLACRPFLPVVLALETAEGVAEVVVEVRDGVGPPPIPDTDGEAPIAAFAATMKARRGVVLEIGARVVGGHSSLNAAQFQPECRFIGCDIHAAPGVDLVADAHFLSRAVTPGSLDGVFSLAVLEHLAAPWMVAAEVNRVLRRGGETLHLVPHAWPVHEQPNDFWRFSEAGLAALFGPQTGFEVLEARLGVPVQIVPPPMARFGAFLQLPMVYAFGAAWVHARKVRDLEPGAVAWPMQSGESQAQSLLYPAHR